VIATHTVKRYRDCHLWKIADATNYRGMTLAVSVNSSKPARGQSVSTCRQIRYQLSVLLTIFLPR
jgi:hypothetical protein